MSVHSIQDLEKAFGFQALDSDALSVLREKEAVCYLAPYGEPDVYTIMCDENDEIDCPEKITIKEFMAVVAKFCMETKIDFPISKEIYERNSAWLNLQDWKRN